VALSLLIGAYVPRRSTLLLPLVVGAVLIATLRLLGRDVSDTPIPFIIVATTTAIAAARARLFRHPSR
jgi:hypothetical protein